jgi:uncharacterized protein YigE (DUF2233 family)
MKRFILALAVTLLLATYFRIGTKEDPVTPQPSAIQTPAPNPTPVYPHVTIDGHAYTVFIYRVGAGQDISLIANFGLKKTSNDIRAEYRCAAVINTGFYSTEDKPLGMFITDGNEIGPAIRSQTFNGYVSQTGSVVSITRSAPDLPVSWAVQTGPVIFENGSPVRLSIRNDETARRSVFALDKNGLPVIMMVVSDEQSTTGPELAKLPEVISAIDSGQSLDLRDAINLDGGSASAFISPDAELSELSGVGSFFCVQ